MVADERVRFGTTDLLVSRLCQGTAFRNLARHADEPQAQVVLHHCLDRGVNFFDSAIAYGWGGAEALGDHWRRFKEIRVDYIHCNLLEGAPPLLAALRDEPNAVICTYCQPKPSSAGCSASIGTGNIG